MIERNTDEESKKFWDFVDKEAKEVSYWPTDMFESVTLAGKEVGSRTHIKNEALEKWFWNKVRNSEYSEILLRLEELEK